MAILVPRWHVRESADIPPEFTQGYDDRKRKSAKSQLLVVEAAILPSSRRHAECVLPFMAAAMADSALLRLMRIHGVRRRGSIRYMSVPEETG